MTIRTVGDFGSVDVTYEESALVGRVVIDGTLTVGAGQWRIVSIVSDSRQSLTETAEGTGSLVVAADFMALRQETESAMQYRVVVYADESGTWVPRVAISDTFTVPALPAANGTMPVGVQVYPMEPGDFVAPDQYPWDTWLDLMPAGVDLVRVGVPWAVLQPTSAAFDPTWGTYWDGVFTECGTRGLSVVLTVGTSPQWARTGGTAISPPDNAATFGQWVDDVLDRWSGMCDIVALDPWNEPNLDTFFSGTDAQWVALVRAAHDAAAGRVPTSFGSLSMCDSAFVASLIANGLTGDDFDVVDIHPYPFSVTDDRWYDPAFTVNDGGDRTASLACGIHLIEQELGSIGADGRPYVISETGFSYAPTESPNAARLSGPAGAAFLTEQVRQARRVPGMIGLAVHEARDLTASGGTFGSWNFGWGLIDANHNRRATWSALDALV